MFFTLCYVLVKLLFYFIKNIYMELSIKLIKSFIPKREFYDGTKLDGISLKENSYDLFYSNYDNTFTFRTSTSNPLIKILREHFDVIYKKHLNNIIKTL